MCLERLLHIFILLLYSSVRWAHRLSSTASPMAKMRAFPWSSCAFSAEPETIWNCSNFLMQQGQLPAHPFSNFSSKGICVTASIAELGFQPTSSLLQCTQPLPNSVCILEAWWLLSLSFFQREVSGPLLITCGMSETETYTAVLCMLKSASRAIQSLSLST